MKPERDILEEIRDKLGELPERLAEQLRSSRQMRFQQTVGWGGGQGETKGDERWRATEGLLGASGLPIFTQLADAMGQARRLDEAWTRFAEAWKPSPFTQTTLPLTGPLPGQQFPSAEPIGTYGTQDSWHADEAEPASPLPGGFRTLPNDWQRHQADDPARREDEAFRRRMAQLVKELPLFLPGPDYKPEAPAPATPLPEGFDLKPEDWRPQPFEVMPEERWQPAPATPDPAWMNQKPDIDFAPEWKPQEQPDLKPLRETPEGWQDVKPLLPLSTRQGWQDTLAGDGGGVEGGGSREVAEKLDQIVEKLEELVSVTENASDSETGPPSEDERERGGRQSMWSREGREREGGERREERPRRVSMEGRPPRIPVKEESGSAKLIEEALKVAKKGI